MFRIFSIVTFILSTSIICGCATEDEGTSAVATAAHLTQNLTHTDQPVEIATPTNANQGENTQSLDILTFGNSSSESDHNFVSDNTEVVEGAFGQTARRMLPRDPAELYGGNLTFELKVDPNRRNYVSIKLWGDDGGNADIGRIYLYVLEGDQEYQVGYRHEGDYMPLSVSTWGKDLPGRFFYSTTMLPFEMTRGKSSIKLRLISTGRLYGLGQGGPPKGNYQLAMKRASKAVYRAYSHTEAYLNVSDEIQATIPEFSVPTNRAGEEVLEPEGAFTKRIGDWIWKLMNKNASDLGQGDAAYLAKAYHVPETYIYQKSAVVEKVVAIIDKYATAFYPDKHASGWGGAFGYIGKAIHYLHEELEPYYDTVKEYGDGGKMTRRQAWGDMLFASREFGRFTRSERSLTNQAMIANDNIYMANKGLLHLGDDRAFAEKDAQRYIKEACGLLPYLGGDKRSGGHYKEFGSNYHLVTKKGLTRERGYVGTSYGEMAFHVAEWYEVSGNEEFRKQAAKMQKARAPFRRPGLDFDGDKVYPSMLSVGLLSWRGAPESDGELVGTVAYAGRAKNAMQIRVAGATADPSLIGYARHMIEDKFFFSSLLWSSDNYKSLAGLDVFRDYKVIKNADDNGVRLPMADSTSNYAWADEENAIAALKHGDERLWVSAYWQAKYGINSLARFHYSTSSYDQYGVMETTPLVETESWTTRPWYYIDKPEGNQWAPPNQPRQAYGGEFLPIAAKPADARSSSPFRGRADFYRLRFGHFLVGMNAHPSTSFVLMAENDQGSATDLFSGSAYSHSTKVAPGSTVALYLNAEADQKPRPSTPIWIQSIADGTTAEVTWSPASGAKHYALLRSNELNGVYQTIATNITDTQYTDSNLPQANQKYYYRVEPYSDGGNGYRSTATLPFFKSLPDGWKDANIGTGSSGTSLHDPSRDEIRVIGTGWDVGSKGDSIHFTYKKVDGDATLVARVQGWWNGSNRNKLGLMIREDLKSNAKSAMVLLDQEKKHLRFASRSNSGGNTSWQNAYDLSIWSYKWLKIERTGNLITAYASNDDNGNWTEIGQATIDMNSEVYIGMAVAPRSGSRTLTTRFKVLDFQD